MKYSPKSVAPADADSAIVRAGLMTTFIADADISDRIVRLYEANDSSALERSPRKKRSDVSAPYRDRQRSRPRSYGTNTFGVVLNSCQ